MSHEALTLLNSQPAPPQATESMIERLAIEGVALARLHKFPESEGVLDQAGGLCSTTPDSICGNVIRARGVLAMERGDSHEGARLFDESLSFARTHGDQFLEATALLNLGAAALKEQHFDEVIDWLEPARELSTSIDAESIAVKAVGDLGWAYYNLGDSDQALELSHQAEIRAVRIGAVRDQLSWITNSGYVYADRGNFSRAKDYYQRAYGLARDTDGKEHIYNALRALALVSVESGELEDARKYSEEAIAIARADNNRLDELYPLLVKGMIDARSHDEAEAERIFREVERDKGGNSSLKWRAEHALARLYEDENLPDAADREYQAALATFEAARRTLKRNDARLPFFANASRIYDDYIHFLVAQKRNGDALRWADHSRARTLAEGLGALPAGKSTEPSPLHAQAIARRAGGTLLFYWLGEKQSLLWVITARKTSLFTLPAGSLIEAAVERYRAALVGPHDVLESADDDGQLLYRMLITPAQSLLPKDAKVFILPDGKLNNLNFETLLVPAPKLHFWIEDVTIANASSLLLLGASSSGASDFGTTKHNRSLLLIGNSLPPNDKYPPLPKAGAQMDAVARHFSQAQWKTLTGAEATPQAYLDGHPELFSHIHFVAHGIASRLSPLDSAIVLSSRGAESDSFKLYARDILLHPLRAELVTVSACYGAGGPSYSGEGLVGLSWAFLRAGAHNVIAALWEVTDASTPQLMDQFYHGIERGESPDAALRAAKLALLHDSRFHNPFYWAPFQFYVGSRAGSKSTNHAQTSAALAP